MRTKGLILMICVLVAFTANAAKVKGNGNVITKEISVSEFESIEVGGNINSEGKGFGKKEGNKFLYSQKTGKASLSITMDENLFSYLDIQSSNGRLSIKTKNRDQIAPTKLLMHGMSKGLKKVSVSGAMDFIVETPLKLEDLKMSVSGAGDIIIPKQANIKLFNLSISGAGDVKADDLTCQEFESSISGAGDIELKGKADYAKFSVSGAGDVKAYDFIVKRVKASVSGAGDIKVYATEKLDASTSGVGDISYKGSPETNIKKSGLGSVKNK